MTTMKLKYTALDVDSIYWESYVNDLYERGQGEIVQPYYDDEASIKEQIAIFDAYSIPWRHPKSENGNALEEELEVAMAPSFWGAPNHDGINEIIHERTGAIASYHFWPLPDLREEDAERVAIELADTAFLLVDAREMFGSYLLGLCGGGMDFSSSLINAYALAGYYPPVNVARRIDHWEESETVKTLAKESLNTMKSWCESALGRIEPPKEDED